MERPTNDGTPAADLKVEQFLRRCVETLHLPLGEQVGYLSGKTCLTWDNVKSLIRRLDLSYDEVIELRKELRLLRDLFDLGDRDPIRSRELPATRRERPDLSEYSLDDLMREIVSRDGYLKAIVEFKGGRL